MLNTSRGASDIRLQFCVFLHLAWILFDLEGAVFNLGLAVCDLERAISDTGWSAGALATNLTLVISCYFIREVVDFVRAIIHLGGTVLDFGRTVLGFCIHSSC